MVVGGFPEAVRRPPRRRSAFFDAYLTTLIQRDVLEISSIERHGELLKLLALLAGRAGGLLVPGTLAGQSGIPRTTLVRYLELLTSVFLIKSIPAWSTGQTARVIGTPKLAFVDTGIACHLLGQDLNRLDAPGGASGPMMENFVLMELARQLTWSEERGRLFHRIPSVETPAFRRGRKRNTCGAGPEETIRCQGGSSSATDYPHGPVG